MLGNRVLCGQPMPMGLPAQVQLLLSQAQRLTTTMACGGQMVWHRWGRLRAGRVPLLLLHGGSGSWTHWLRNIEPLVAAGHELWVPDLPGFGDSDVPPEGDDADAMLAPLQAAWMQLLAGQPVCLVGFSFGAMLAGMWAAATAALAQRLVLVGAPAMGVAQQQLPLQGFRHLPDGSQQLAVHQHNLAALMLTDAQLIADPVTQALQRHNAERDRLPRRRLSRTDILARSLTAVRCPVHVIYGAQDALYPGRMAQLHNAYMTSAPGFVGMELIADSGHWVQYQQPRAFEQVLLRLLSAASEL